VILVTVPVARVLYIRRISAEVRMKPSVKGPSIRPQWREVVGLAFTLLGVVGLVLYFLGVIG